MGGNLFNLGRMPWDRYLAIEFDVCAYLTTRFGSDSFRIPRYYAEKPDFGDLDVIICTDRIPGEWSEIRMEIVRDLGVKRYKSTGAVFSTVFRGLQVDYFTRGEPTFESTYTYMCYNDLGNLLGKMFRRLGMKYGEHGLSYVYRGLDGRWKREFLLTRNRERIFSFLGLDPVVWDRGFETLESMFRWVVGSPFFSVAPYCERRATTERRRKRRPTIDAFVRFLDAEGIDAEYPYHDDRSLYIPMIERAFPESNLVEQVRQAENDWQRVQSVRQRFNGNRVRDLVDLDGKELGRFMGYVRASRNDFDDWVLNAESDEIEAEIVRLYEGWKES